MRPFNGIKPQDIAILLKLVALGDKKWRHVDLVAALGLSQTEISFALNRCRTVGFLDSAKKKVMKAALLEFLIHGLKYVFPARPGPIARGLPTAHSAAPLAAEKDKALYELLALVDAVRAGRAREQALAIRELEARLGKADK